MMPLIITGLVFLVLFIIGLTDWGTRPRTGIPNDLSKRSFFYTTEDPLVPTGWADKVDPIDHRRDPPNVR